MFLIDIIYEGQTYKSAEHLYFAEFARHHNRLDLQGIIDARDGYEAKRKIRNIKMDDTWDNVKFKIMRKIVSLKLDQNDGIRDKLLGATGFLMKQLKTQILHVVLHCLMPQKSIRLLLRVSIMVGIILCEYRDERLGINM